MPRWLKTFFVSFAWVGMLSLASGLISVVYGPRSELRRLSDVSSQNIRSPGLPNEAVRLRLKQLNPEDAKNKQLFIKRHLDALCKGREGPIDPKCADPDYVDELIRTIESSALAFALPNPIVEAQIQDREEQIAENARQFKKIKFKYNRPTTLNYKKSNTLVLSIASADIEAAEARVVAGTGPVRTAEARFGDQVKASLEGDPNSVDIQLASSPTTNASIKSLSSAANSTWTWYVTPKTLDKITLTLSIFNEVEVDGEQVEIEGPVYRDTILINASFWDKWSSLLNSFWGGAIAFRRHRRIDNGRDRANALAP